MLDAAVLEARIRRHPPPQQARYRARLAALGDLHDALPPPESVVDLYDHLCVGKDTLRLYEEVGGLSLGGLRRVIARMEAIVDEVIEGYESEWRKAGARGQRAMCLGCMREEVVVRASTLGVLRCRQCWEAG